MHTDGFIFLKKCKILLEWYEGCPIYG